MTPSQNAIDLIKKFEGCKLHAYPDSGGVWTIGWGSTGPGIREGLEISQKTADAMLVGHVREVGIDLNDLIGHFRLNQNRFDAITCFVYNVGLKAFKDSTMLKLIKVNKMEEASKEFLRWNKCAGKVLKGLTNRREAERELFDLPSAALL